MIGCGKIKCTLIESMAGKGIVIKPGFRQEFRNFEEAKSFIESKGWKVNIGFIKGSPIMREIQKGCNDGICDVQEKTRS